VKICESKISEAKSAVEITACKLGKANSMAKQVKHKAHDEKSQGSQNPVIQFINRASSVLPLFPLCLKPATGI
jgi:hypothetical protein